MQKQAATRRREIEGRRLDIAEEELGLRKIGIASDILKTINKDDRTAAVKNYEFHVEQSKLAGKDPLTFGQWEKDRRTTNQKDFDRYKAEGGNLDFHQWMLGLKKAGATRISVGELAERKKQLGAVGEIQDITSFKFREKIEATVRKRMKEEDFQFDILPIGIRNARIEKAVRDEMDTLIRASGEVERAEPGRDVNGKLGWNVTFKDGETKWIGFE